MQHARLGERLRLGMRGKVAKLILFAALFGILWPAATGIANAVYVTQGYKANGIIPTGALVSVQQDDASTVEIASLRREALPIGATSTTAQSVVAVNITNANAQVVTSGATKLLASDINGIISAGDPLALSPIDGVAMRATASGTIIGFAETGSSQLEDQLVRRVTDKDGKEKSVVVGLLPATVQVGEYQIGGTQGGSQVVSGIQAISSNLAGKKLTPWRAVAAFGVVILATVAAMIILFSAVTSSIRSIGRNPLAKHAVLKSLGQVVFAVIIIIFAAFAGVYIIVGV